MILNPSCAPYKHIIITYQKGHYAVKLSSRKQSSKFIDPPPWNCAIGFFMSLKLNFALKKRTALCPPPLPLLYLAHLIFWGGGGVSGHLVLIGTHSCNPSGSPQPFGTLTGSRRRQDLSQNHRAESSCKASRSPSRLPIVNVPGTRRVAKNWLKWGQRWTGKCPFIKKSQRLLTYLFLSRVKSFFNYSSLLAICTNSHRIQLVENTTIGKVLLVW